MDRDSDDEAFIPPVDEDERTATRIITIINDVIPILDADKPATEEMPV